MLSSAGDQNPTHRLWARIVRRPVPAPRLRPPMCRPSPMDARSISRPIWSRANTCSSISTPTGADPAAPSNPSSSTSPTDTPTDWPFERSTSSTGTAKCRANTGFRRSPTWSSSAPMAHASPPAIPRRCFADSNPISAAVEGHGVRGVAVHRRVPLLVLAAILAVTVGLVARRRRPAQCDDRFRLLHLAGHRHGGEPGRSRDLVRPPPGQSRRSLHPRSTR